VTFFSLFAILTDDSIGPENVRLVKLGLTEQSMPRELNRELFADRTCRYLSAGLQQCVHYDVKLVLEIL